MTSSMTIDAPQSHWRETTERGSGQRVSVLTLESNSEAASRDRDRIDTRAPKVVFTPASVMKPPVAGGFARF